MAGQVIVYLGTDRSGKIAELLRHYRDALRTGAEPGIDRAYWIAPNARAAAHVRGRLMADGLDACFGPGVMTLDDFAGQCLSRAKSRLRIMTPMLERELLRRTVQTAIERDELRYYAPTARRESFVDLMYEHVRELRRRGITAEKFAKLRSKVRHPDQHREIAQLYTEYDRVLVAHKLLDAESVSWAACDALASQTNDLFRGVSLLVVDGFSDFSAAQHKLLSLMAKSVEQILISISTDEPSDDTARGDLFAKPRATIAELHRTFPKLEERQFAAQPSACAAISHIARQVFRHPISPAKSDVLESLHRIELIEASGAQDEVVQIARRIKRLLLGLPGMERAGEDSQGGRARPQDIVVVLRSLTEAAPRIREVFGEFGIPYSLERGESLASAPIVKTLLSLLRLDKEDWPFRRTVAVLTNSTLTAVDAEGRRSADWLVRDLQIASGRKALIDRVQQLAETRTLVDELGDRARRRVVAAKAALPVLELISDAFDCLPSEAIALQWADALTNLAAKLGFAPVTDDTVPKQKSRPGGQAEFPNLQSPIQPADQNAWQLIIDSLAELERLDLWLGQAPRRLSRRDLVTLLEDIVQDARIPCANDDVGRVRVLSAPTARAIPCKHLFLGGMTEQSFPAAERPGRLATEGEYRFFARAASQSRRPVSAAAPEPTRSQEEMLLFYELVSCAQESLTISYSALDDKAQTLPPSPYVMELCRAIGNESRQLHVAKPRLSPIPAGETPLSPGEWRLQAVSQALEGRCGLVAGLFSNGKAQPVGRSIESGLRIVHARSRRDGFCEAEGLVTSAAAAARFAERFGGRHLWSPSQWETYAACPYRFFLESVLRLEPLGELVLETDFARRGGRLHDVLAEFHRQWPAVRETACASPDEEAMAFVAHFKNVVDQMMADTPRSGIDAAALELDRRQIGRWAESHFEQHRQYERHWEKAGENLAPAHFEFRFGPARPGEVNLSDPQSCDEPFSLRINGETVLVTGRIDRIDVARIGERIVFNVIDYKSGRKPKLQEEHIASGEHLQLAIYVAAAQAILYDGKAQPLAAGYWSMSSGFDSKGVLAVPQEDANAHWTRISALVEDRVGELIAGIRQGHFPVASRDERCTSYCRFNTVCRITQVRSLDKTWPSGAAGQPAPTNSSSPRDTVSRS